MIANLQERDHGLDSGAAAQQRRRLDAIGEWRTRRDQDRQPPRLTPRRYARSRQDDPCTPATPLQVRRPDKHDYATLADESWFVHGGNRADDTTGAIRTPIVMGNSYSLPEDPTTIEDPGYDGSRLHPRVRRQPGRLMMTLDTAQIYELDRAHVFHSWSSQAKIAPMVVTRAEGSLVWDGDGNEPSGGRLRRVNRGGIPRGRRP